MVTEGLNNIAITLGRQVREALEAEVIDFDVQVAQASHEHKVLTDQAKAKNEQTNKLWRFREEKAKALGNLDADLRELNRPREGFPYLDDVAYETRMHELRMDIQERSEKLAKRDSWSQ